MSTFKMCFLVKGCFLCNLFRFVHNYYHYKADWWIYLYQYSIDFSKIM